MVYVIKVYGKENPWYKKGYHFSRLLQSCIGVVDIIDGSTTISSVSCG